MNAVRNFFPINNETFTFDYGTARDQEAFVRSYSNTAQRFAKAGKNVIYVVDIPTRPDPRDCAARITGMPAVNDVIHAMKDMSNRRCYLPRALHDKRMQTYRELLQTVEATNANVKIFDVTDMMCDHKECPADRDGQPLYSYADHVSDHAATTIGAALAEYLRAQMEPTEVSARQ